MLALFSSVTCGRGAGFASRGAVIRPRSSLLSLSVAFSLCVSLFYFRGLSSWVVVGFSPRHPVFSVFLVTFTFPCSVIVFCEGNLHAYRLAGPSCFFVSFDPDF